MSKMNLIPFLFVAILSVQNVKCEISLRKTQPSLRKLSLRKLYPLITPVLGNISIECKNASYNYIENLSEALRATRLEIFQVDATASL